MKHIRKNILLLLLVLAHIFANGRFYYFKHYQADEGLLHNNVTCIIQDKLGFIWLGTKAGLNRFDGYTFKSYIADRTRIGSNYIKTIRQDSKGMFWIGTSSGIFKLNPAAEAFQPLKLFPGASIRDIKIDAADNIWIITRGALYKYNQYAPQLITYDIPVTAIDIDNANHLWMTIAHGKIKKLDIGTGRVTDVPVASHQKGGPQGINLIRYVNNSLLIGAINGLFEYNFSTRQVTPVLIKNEKGAEIFVRDIFIPGKSDNCYIATESGLFIYNLSTSEIINLKKVPGDPYSLNDNAVYSVYADNRKGVWLGTFFGGLNYFSEENNQFEKYYPLNTPGSISGNAVREICEDARGNIWIGTEDAGINRFDKTTGTFYQVNQGNLFKGPSYPNIHGLLVDNHKLYVGPFFHGLEVIDISSGKIVDRHPRDGNGYPLGGIVMSIFKTSENRILIGTTGAGLYEYNTRLKKLAPVKYIPRDSYVYAIAEDHTGTIWTGALIKGAFYYNPKTGRHGNINFNSLEDTARNSYIVQGIYEDSNYFIWLATEGGGLFKIDSNRRIVKRYTTASGLPSNNLYRILEDSRGNLWISSLKGLIRFNPYSEKIQVYTKSNGLITDQFNYNSAYKDKNGKMYFGTVKGMIAFQPEQLTKMEIAPPLYITGLFFNNDTQGSANTPGLKNSILSADSITLTHLQSSFNIAFAALDFASARAVRYRYKMEGTHKDWIYLSSNRKVYFTDLPAGTYRFIVQAESNLGDWVSKERTIVIKILPPFWKSTPALILYALIVMALIWLALYLHHQNLKKKNEHKLQLFELEKEKEVYHTKINFFTNVAHEIQTPLTLIKGPVEWALSQIDNAAVVKRNLELVKKNTNRLVTLTSQLLDFRKMETNQFELNFSPVDICLLFNNCLTYFNPEIEKRNLTIHISQPSKEIIAVADEEAFTKIMSNLLSNAIKYSDKLIEVHLYVSNEEPGYFKLKVINDGEFIQPAYQKKIFDPFYRIPTTHIHLPGTGIGLSLAKSLAEMHKGRLEFVANDQLLNIFELTLPLSQEQNFQLITENDRNNESILINN